MSGLFPGKGDSKLPAPLSRLFILSSCHLLIFSSCHQFISPSLHLFITPSRWHPSPGARNGVSCPRRGDTVQHTSFAFCQAKGKSAKYSTLKGGDFGSRSGIEQTAQSAHIKKGTRT